MWSNILKEKWNDKKYAKDENNDIEPDKAIMLVSDLIGNRLLRDNRGYPFRRKSEFIGGAYFYIRTYNFY